MWVISVVIYTFCSTCSLNYLLNSTINMGSPVNMGSPQKSSNLVPCRTHQTPYPFGRKLLLHAIDLSYLVSEFRHIKAAREAQHRGASQKIRLYLARPKFCLYLQSLQIPPPLRVVWNPILPLPSNMPQNPHP